MNIRYIFTITLLCCFVHSLNAQTKQIDSLKKILSKMPADSNKVKTLRLLFIETIDKVNADEAIMVGQQQLKLAQRIHFIKGEAMAYKLLSVGYQTAGNPQKAIVNALNSLKIYEKLKDEKGVASAYSNIGVVCWDENELDEALVNFEKSLAIFRKIKAAPENIWRSIINIGITYKKKHQDSLALAYFINAEAVSKSIALKIFNATSLYQIADIYFNQNKYQLATQYLNNALKLIPEAREAYPVAEIYLLLSKLYIKQQQFSKALSAAQTGLDLVKSEKYKPQLVKNYLQMADVYVALGNYKAAYRYKTLYVNLKDSLLNIENIRKIDELQFNYRLEKKEQDLLKGRQLRDTQLLLQKVTIQRQYTLVAFISVALLSFIVLSLKYYQDFKMKKRDNELLTLNQEKIMQQNEEITVQNEEINKQKESLAEINETKNKLFSIISHDLRSPVLTLQEALSMFNDQLLSHEEIEAMSAELLANVESTSAMLDNVLYWAKNQMEGLHLNVKVFDVSKLINLNLNNFNKAASNKGISLVNEVTEEFRVLADESSIDIVLRNLISNAIKFCSANDRIHVSCKTVGAFVQISVKDTGKGMSEAIVKRLFNTADFYSTYGTANEKGTGIGLNLCQEFVTMNGGTIWVTSTLGQGSIFAFNIPVANFEGV